MLFTYSLIYLFFLLGSGTKGFFPFSNIGSRSSATTPSREYISRFDFIVLGFCFSYFCLRRVLAHYDARGRPFRPLL
uniref:Putative secreted peptide n=1 Tax=Anopheles braziliensis TaxID=58242 RepID=A0A2M3ZVA5_9DIPT